MGFDWQQFKELFSFGKWVLGSTVLIFLVLNGDAIFVGKILGLTALGFYQLAYKFSNMPSTEITYVISQVTFPAYSKLQDNLPRLRDAYLKVLQITAFLSFPIAGLIFVLAPDFIRIFLGEKWMPMMTAMRILVFRGLITTIGAGNGALLQAVGRPDILTKLNAIKLTIIMILIYPLSVKWGIAGTSSVVFLSALLITPNTFRIVRANILMMKRFVIVKAMLLPFIGAAFMVLVLRVFMRDNISLAGFVLLALMGVASYLLVTYILDKLLNEGKWYGIAKSLAWDILR
jgi:O-antigen/teichoic acid export membrane protein